MSKVLYTFKIRVANRASRRAPAPKIRWGLLKARRDFWRAAGKLW